MTLRPLSLALALALGLTTLTACQPAATPAATPAASTAAENTAMAERVARYAEVTLSADLSHLSEGDRQAVGLLIDAGQIIDGLFWQQVWGDRQDLLARTNDPATARYIDINYGPWDLLDGDKPFVDGIGPRPAGAGFYPADMTREEFAAAELPGKDSQYTLLRRDDAGKLVVVPYSVAYKAELEQALKT